MVCDYIVISKLGYLKSKEEASNVRIAGSLMGTVYTNKIHITNCYAVTLEEEDDSEVYIQQYQQFRCTQ